MKKKRIKHKGMIFNFRGMFGNYRIYEFGENRIMVDEERLITYEYTAEEMRKRIEEHSKNIINGKI